MTQSRRGMTAIEAAVTVVLLVGFLGAALGYHQLMLRRAKALALQADLQSFRASLAFFEARKGRRPSTLDEIVLEPIGRLRLDPGSGRWARARDHQQRWVDAFGFPYTYDAGTGVIKSTTPGYESW